MSVELKPGIYRATVKGVPDTLVLRDDVDRWWSTELRGWGYFHDDRSVTDVRPLIVLDLVDPSATASLLRRSATGRHLESIADQIEAQTKPPRIPEPGLWGVVEAHTAGQPKRLRYGKTRNDTWVREGAACGYSWCELLDPVLVREGVE